jgi:uncharacterized protein YndB with AHSA1/START domain
MNAKKIELDPKMVELEEITQVFLSKMIACMKCIQKVLEKEVFEQEDLRELLCLIIQSIHINVDFIFEFLIVERDLRKSNVSEEGLELLAVVQKVENGYTAHFERCFKHSVEKAWSMLTENEKLSQWFAELRIDNLREGGMIKFDMQDGSFEEMEILELKMYSVLEYTWGEDIVRFELYPEPEGCRLVLIEKIKEITNHTPRDLAGWHVCLDVIHALLDGRTIESREEEWKKWYEEYVRAIAKVSENQS